MRREGVESEEEFFLSTGWGLSFLCENNAFVSISDICVVLSVCGGVWCMPPYELCFFSLLRVGANAPLPLPAGAHVPGTELGSPRMGSRAKPQLGVWGSPTS